MCAVSRGSGEGEGRVAVGDQKGRVRVDAQPPAGDTDNEIEQPPRVVPGEQDREPRDDHRKESNQLQHCQNDVVRDREQPLHQREPLVQVVFDVGVVDVEVDALLLDR
jgi:hypothetical protein